MASSSRPESCAQWMQKIHTVQSKRTPEAWQAAQHRIEQSRLHEVSYRKCKAVKSHAVRSRALAAESLRQMAVSERPEEHLAVQARWKSAQEASKARRCMVMKKADDALAVVRADVDEAMSDAEGEEDAAMVEVAQLVGAADVRSMAAVGQEGLPSSEGPRPANAAGRNAGTVQNLLQQLRHEPKDEAECTAKFLLYEGYGAEVEEMRSTLFKFHEDSRSTVPAAVAADMDKRIKGVDSAEAMGIPDESREWFVFHMMRQAERNNLHMASILDGFEKKLEFLASNDQNECPVCLEDFADTGAHAPETLSCCHKVCKDCWTNWSAVMHSRPFCPLCRHEEFLGALAEQM